MAKKNAEKDNRDVEKKTRGQTPVTGTTNNAGKSIASGWLGYCGLNGGRKKEPKK